MKIYRECDFCKKELEENKMTQCYGDAQIFMVCSECDKRYQEYDKQQQALYRRLKDKLEKETLKLQEEYQVIQQFDTKIRVEDSDKE